MCTPLANPDCIPNALQEVSRNEADLVAKCYYSKKKLVWEVLKNGLKSKIEIQWSDISAIRATLREDQPGILEIEVCPASSSSSFSSFLLIQLGLSSTCILQSTGTAQLSRPRESLLCNCYICCVIYPLHMRLFSGMEVHQLSCRCLTSTLELRICLTERGYRQSFKLDQSRSSVYGRPHAQNYESRPIWMLRCRTDIDRVTRPGILADGVWFFSSAAGSGSDLLPGIEPAAPEAHHLAHDHGLHQRPGLVAQVGPLNRTQHVNVHSK